MSCNEQAQQIVVIGKFSSSAFTFLYVTTYMLILVIPNTLLSFGF